MKIKLSERERDTVLAALRLWQWERELGCEALLSSRRGSEIVEIAKNDRIGGDATLLAGEIGALCERLNFGA